MTQVDIPRLRKGVEWVEEQAAREDSAWYQKQWTTIKTSVLNRLRREGKTTLISRYRHEVQVMGITGDLEALQAGCGSAYCLAGHLCQEAGDIPVIYTGQDPAATVYNISNMEDTVHSQLVLTPDDVLMSVCDRASQLLGVPSEKTVGLFRPNNTAEEVRAFAEAIAGERL